MMNICEMRRNETRQVTSQPNPHGTHAHNPHTPGHLAYIKNIYEDSSAKASRHSCPQTQHSFMPNIFAWFSKVYFNAGFIHVMTAFEALLKSLGKGVTEATHMCVHTHTCMHVPRSKPETAFTNVQHTVTVTVTVD